MPSTEVVLFKDGEGKTPVLDWLDEQQEKVQDKFMARIERLGELGHELRRPDADFLRDGIYELRVKHFRVNLRILYFFHDHKALLSHGLAKEDAVPPKEIEMAVSNKILFAKNPSKHTHVEEEQQKQEKREE
jgi:phage-related protein